MNKLQEINNKIVNELQSKLEDIIVEGLKLKGYEFEDKKSLFDFVSKNCTVINQSHLNINTYVVKDIPFLHYDYSFNIKKVDELSCSFKAEGGKYRFL